MDSEGYLTLPSGIVIQWGNVYKTTGGDAWIDVTFLRAFSSAVFAITTGLEDTKTSTSSGYGYIKAGAITLSGFDLMAYGQSGDTIRHTYWMAIGQ